MDLAFLRQVWAAQPADQIVVEAEAAYPTTTNTAPS
jgi:hypothetical protein